MATADTQRIEAPVTIKAYFMCVFAAFGGFFFGYDSGYISGVLGMKYFIHTFQHLPYPPPGPTPSSFVISSPHNSLIVSILSAGTFFGALIAGDLSDWFGRRTTIIAGCFLFAAGVVIQIASSTIPVLAVGRIIAGFGTSRAVDAFFHSSSLANSCRPGVGFVSAIIILYMSEVAPRKVRGAIVAGYQFAITIGLMVASCVDYATENRLDSGSYRIPISIQLIPAIILATGLFILPESPRFFVIHGQLEKAAAVLARVRGQPQESEYIQLELAEIVANHEYEMSVIPQSGYFSSWANCFKGSLWQASSNLRRTILGTSLQ
jgi:MFS family permease